MKIFVEIENIEDLVELEAEPTLEDDSYSDEFGLVKIKPYITFDESEVTWDEKLYSKEDNKIISEWVKDNSQDIATLFGLINLKKLND